MLFSAALAPAGRQSGIPFTAWRLSPWERRRALAKGDCLERARIVNAFWALGKSAALNEAFDQLRTEMRVLFADEFPRRSAVYECVKRFCVAALKPYLLEYPEEAGVNSLLTAVFGPDWKLPAFGGLNSADVRSEPPCCAYVEAIRDAVEKGVWFGKLRSAPAYDPSSTAWKAEYVSAPCRRAMAERLEAELASHHVTDTHEVPVAAGPKRRGRPASKPHLHENEVRSCLQQASLLADRSLMIRDLWTAAGYSDDTQYNRWQLGASNPKLDRLVSNPDLVVKALAKILP